MKKIEKMTPEQEAKVPVYLKKWLDNGRKTTRIDKTKTIEAIKTIYECAGMKAPKHFMFFPSPIQCQLAINILKSDAGKQLLQSAELNESNLGSNLRSNLGSNLWSNLDSNLWSNLWSNLDSNLRSNLGSNLRSNLESNLWSNLDSNLRSNLRSNLESNLESNLDSNLWSNLDSNLWSNLWSNLDSNLRSNLDSNLWSNLRSTNLKYENIFWGNHWTYWVGRYDFILNELFTDKIEEYKDFTAYLTALQNVHLFIPFDNIVFISDNPVSITLDSQGRLHHEEAPAMMYADGYSLFYMNGIQIPKKFIETRKDDIEPKDVLALQNTEQRMVLMRYVGLPKFLKDLGAKIIHEYKGYKLMYLTVENVIVGPYLGMTCPSSGREFLEGVGDPSDNLTIDPDIKTCQDALRWRMDKASKNLMTKFNLKWQMDA